VPVGSCSAQFLEETIKSKLFTWENLFQLSKQINIWLLLPIAMFLGFELTLMWFEFYRVYFF
jgi:hypothetical protein